MRRCDYDRVLFVGTGGGNDVFSATLAMAALKRLGWRWRECALAGVLSPFHEHTTSPTKFAGVDLVSSVSERRLIRRGDERRIGFIDARVAEMIAAEAPHGCTQVFGLSLRRGSEGLALAFRALASEYELIVLVDLGGDIFYPAKDSRVLSPMFDAIVLRAFVDSGVNGLLFEAGPGTDGELLPETIREALAGAEADRYKLDPDLVQWWGSLYKRWIEPVRPGRTVPMTLQAYHSSDPELVVSYRARQHLGERKWYHHFDQRIDTDLNRHFFIADPAKINNPFAVQCGGPLTWFRGTQAAQLRTNCEANLEYYSYDGLWQFLTPTPLLPRIARENILLVALVEQMLSPRCDELIMWSDDWSGLGRTITNRFSSWEMGDGLISVHLKPTK